MDRRRPASDTAFLVTAVIPAHAGVSAWPGRTMLAAALLLAACSGGKDQPGAVTADEARQLNDAAAMLDANSVDANAVGADAAPTNESDPGS